METILLKAQGFAEMIKGGDRTTVIYIFNILCFLIISAILFVGDSNNNLANFYRKEFSSYDGS